MAGISCPFLLSPAPAPPLYSRHRPASARGGAHRPVRVRHQISCCSKPDNSEECETSKSPSSGKVVWRVAFSFQLQLLFGLH